MNNFAKFAAKQKAKANERTNETQPAQAPGDGNTNVKVDAGAAVDSHTDSNQSGQVPSSDSREAGGGTKPSAGVGAKPKPKLASFGVGKKPSAGGSAKQSGPKDDAGVGDDSKSPTSNDDSGESGNAQGVGAKLDALSESVGADAPVRVESQFDDETVPEKPLRDLETLKSLKKVAEATTDFGEKLSEEAVKQRQQALVKNIESFVESLDACYELLHDPEMLANVISNLIMEFQRNPQYEKLIAPEDVRLWISQMRANMGLAQVKKTEKKTKTKSKKKVDLDMLSDLESLANLDI